MMIMVILTTMNKSVLSKIKDNKIILALHTRNSLISLAAVYLKIMIRI
jgi:hypothetical protein